MPVITVTRPIMMLVQLKAAGSAKIKQTGLLCSRQSAPEPKLSRDKTGFSRDRMPGIPCISIDSLHGRRQVTICFAPHLPVFCKYKTGSEALQGYMKEDSEGLFDKALSSLGRTMPGL